MANFDCYVRTYLPLTTAGLPDINNVGWYDLQIDGLNDADLVFDEHTTVNSPVFAFCKNVNSNESGNANNGFVHIFPEADTTTIYTTPLLMCKYKFTASQTATRNFINTMKDMLTYTGKEGNCSLYRVNSGPFMTYTDERYNSFGATAVWANWLGYSGLKSIYDQYTNDSDGYLNYAAWEMFTDRCSAWSFNVLNR